MYSANQWITRGVVSAAVRNDYGKTNGELSVFTNFGRHKIDDGTKDEAAPTQRYFRSKDALTGVSWYQSARLFEGNRLTVGVDYQHIYGHAYYTSKATGEVMDTPNKQSGRSYRNEIAGYVEVRQDVTSWLTVDAGLRLDHHSITGTEWIPQGGLVIRPMATGELKAMASKGFRNPTMREMYLYPPSNTELEPERLWNYELSWRQRMGSVSYGVNLFYIKGDNMIQTVARKNVNTGEVENYGLELEAAWRIDDHWTVNTNHSFLHMNNPVLAAPNTRDGLAAASVKASGVPMPDCKSSADSSHRWRPNGRKRTSACSMPASTTSSVSPSACGCVARTCWHNVMKSSPATPCRGLPSWEEPASGSESTTENTEAEDF